MKKAYEKRALYAIGYHGTERIPGNAKDTDCCSNTKKRCKDMEQWNRRGNNGKSKSLWQKKVYANFKKCEVPVLYATVAEIVYKKAYGHGGFRPGAGRKKDEDKIPKKTYSFRLTVAEQIRVKQFIEDMRKEDGRQSIIPPPKS